MKVVVLSLVEACTSPGLSGEVCAPWSVEKYSWLSGSLLRLLKTNSSLVEERGSSNL